MSKNERFGFIFLAVLVMLSALYQLFDTVLSERLVLIGVVIWGGVIVMLLLACHYVLTEYHEQERRSGTKVSREGFVRDPDRFDYEVELIQNFKGKSYLIHRLNLDDVDLVVTPRKELRVQVQSQENGVLIVFFNPDDPGSFLPCDFMVEIRKKPVGFFSRWT